MAAEARRRGARSGKKPTAVAGKSRAPAAGLDVLSQDEMSAIGEGGEVSEEQLQRIFGLEHGVRHPGRTTGEDAKGGGQKWNPNCFMGLGWKPEKEGRKGKEKQDAGFESALIRPDRVPYGGLKNHGATCYLNSMLQCLFFNMPFRKGIMQLSSAGASLPPGVTAGAGFKPIMELQRIFSHLQLSKARAYAPKAFIDSLNLSTTSQQDAQEFMKMYLTYIENELSKHGGIPSHLRNLVKDNFSGKYAYCTTCKECNTKSPNEVPFYDLDLKVQGIKTLEESLEDFFKEDELVGDNKYQCGQCDKKTEARRGIELLGLPAVLNLQLLRFVYDVNSNSRRKVSSAINFPKVLDLNKWLKRSNLAGSAGGAKRRKASISGRVGGGDAAEDTECAAIGCCIYDLEAIVLHTGASAVQGHYVAYVKNPMTAAWLRFDDEHVSSLEDDEYFGNDEALVKAKKKRKAEERDEMEGRVKSRDAYMLIYRRRTSAADQGSEVGDLAEVECKSLVPEDWRAEIEKDSLELQEQAKTAEEASRSNASFRATALRDKEDIWEVLPDDEADGFWVSTDWLKHWVSMDPQEKCDMIDTCPIASKHKLADPLKVHEMKLISKDAFFKLRDKYGMTKGSDLLKRGNLCVDTIKEECARRSKSQSTKGVLDALKQYLQSTTHASEHGACWISRQWCKERITHPAGVASKYLDENGHHVFCGGRTGDIPEGCSGGEASVAKACGGEKLTPDAKKRRLVSADFVDFLKRNWKEGTLPPMPAAQQDACDVCTAQAARDAQDRELIKNERKKTQLEHKNVYNSTAIKLKPGATYNLLAYKWLEDFRLWCDTVEIAAVPPIDNLSLMTPDGEKLAYDPGDLTPVDVPKFVWVEEDDWKALFDRYSGGPEIKVTPQLPDDRDGLRDVTVNRPAPKSSQALPLPQHVVCLCEPAICDDTIKKAKEVRETERLVYSDQIMTISRHSASALATAPPGQHGGAAPAAPAAGGGSRRGRVRKGECQVNVSSMSTVKSVKLQIYEKLHFSPTEQKLMHDQTELEEGDKTLADYGVPRDAVLQLHILSADGELDDGVRKGKRQREVDAGFSGTLLSGFGLECPSNSAEPIVVPDSQDATDDCHEGAEDAEMTLPAAGPSTADEASAPSASVVESRREDGRLSRARNKAGARGGSEEKEVVTILGEDPPTTRRRGRKSPDDQKGSQNGARPRRPTRSGGKGANSQQAQDVESPERPDDNEAELQRVIERSKQDK